MVKFHIDLFLVHRGWRESAGMATQNRSSSFFPVTALKIEKARTCRRTTCRDAMHLTWLSYLMILLPVILGSWEGVFGAPSEIWSSMRFPDEEVGPDSWSYYRVELPPVFSLLNVSLTRNWPHDDSEIGKAPTVPLVCFGFCGPPLTMPPRESLLDAARLAGASRNASSRGECGWFTDSVVVNVTNLEVRSGTLYVGIFSDASPARTQSKMIPRGEKYAFGLVIQVFWCGTEALGGPQCNLRISPLPPQAYSKSLHSMQTLQHDDQPFLSSRSSSLHIMKEPPSGHQLQADISSNLANCLDSEQSSEVRPPPGCINRNKPIVLKNQKQDEQPLARAPGSEWSNWTQSSQECVNLDEKQIFSLQIVDFVVELEVKYDCISNVSYGISKCEEFETMVKEARIPLLHLKYLALPGVDSSDFLGEPSTGSIIVPEPKRGWWYLSIFNPTVRSTRKKRMELLSAEDEMCLTLSWRTRTCQQSLTGQDCQWPVLSLERFMKDEGESPFDSYYYPVTEADSLEDDSEWFSVENPQNASTSGGTVERWTFAALKVPDGAAGSILSVDVQTPTSVSAELYARHEGCPKDSIWDFQVTKDGSQLGSETTGLKNVVHGLQMLNASRQQGLSLSVVYPMEGYWCLGLKYISDQKTNIHLDVSDNLVIPNNLPGSTDNDAKQVILAWLRRWRFYIYCIKRKLTSLYKSLPNGETSEVRERSTTYDMDARHKFLQSRGERLRVSLHGCANECSGHGRCASMWEASRLRFISYCQCDVTHGGFDCSIVQLGIWHDLRQRTLLIFSNSAAILPSLWALRHHAYSEWVSFTLSGIASAIYHSCDAGGWCAMSYSTLQFLDFWLSFLVIIMTCLLIAGFSGTSKAMLHIGCAILTAAIAKEDATSGWSVFVVVLISSLGLALGWGLETHRVSSLRLMWPVVASPSRFSSGGFQVCRRLVHSFYQQLRDRFRWGHFCLGLAVLAWALFSNMKEMPESYWFWHSSWHIGIYTCAFFLLQSIKVVDEPQPTARDGPIGYQSVPLSSRHDEDDNVAPHDNDAVVELDSLPDNCGH